MRRDVFYSANLATEEVGSPEPIWPGRQRAPESASGGYAPTKTHLPTHLPTALHAIQPTKPNQTYLPTSSTSSSAYLPACLSATRHDTTRHDRRGQVRAHRRLEPRRVADARRATGEGKGRQAGRQAARPSETDLGRRAGAAGGLGALWKGGDEMRGDEMRLGWRS